MQASSLYNTNSPQKQRFTVQQWLALTSTGDNFVGTANLHTSHLTNSKKSLCKTKNKLKKFCFCCSSCSKQQQLSIHTNSEKLRNHNDGDKILRTWQFVISTMLHNTDCHSFAHTVRTKLSTRALAPCAHASPRAINSLQETNT